jgi:hypothetical protein
MLLALENFLVPFFDVMNFTDFFHLKITKNQQKKLYAEIEKQLKFKNLLFLCENTNSFREIFPEYTFK